VCGVIVLPENHGSLINKQTFKLSKTAFLTFSLKASAGAKRKRDK